MPGPLLIGAIGAGASLFNSWRNRKKADSRGSNTQSGGYNIDQGSQDYINYTRGLGRQGADAALGQGGSYFAGADQRSIGDQAQEFFNPYQDNVIQGVRDQAQYQRGLAETDVNAAATSAGAFGGSRHAVETASRKGAIDRNASAQIGGIQHQGYQTALSGALQHNEYRRALQERQLQEPLFRHGQALDFANRGYGGPTGQTTFGSGSNEQHGTGGSAIGQAIGAFTGLYGAVDSYQNRDKGAASSQMNPSGGQPLRGPRRGQARLQPDGEQSVRTSPRWPLGDNLWPRA